MAYRLVEKQVILDAKKVRIELHHLQDEETGKRMRREVCVHPGAAVIIGVRDDGKILLIRNRRYTIGQTLLELPAGTLENQEDPINCAGRELLEETGYLAGRLTPVCAFFSSPGILTEKMYVFAAYDLEMRKTALEEGEEIELEPVTLEDAIEMIGDGQIQDGKTIAALLMFDRFKGRAKAQA